MTKILNIILASLSVIFSIVIQKIIFRLFALQYDNLFIYWGSFLIIFIIIFGLMNIINDKKNNQF
ncbi:bacteriocin-like WGxF protein [Clostridium sporogenes]|uniref:bacteriocin-like WGxF protein n=1 Tax=Clostridium sporogenes TaxID=1509 RepID=UPI003F8DF33D